LGIRKAGEKISGKPPGTPFFVLGASGLPSVCPTGPADKPARFGDYPSLQTAQDCPPWNLPVFPLHHGRGQPEALLSDLRGAILSALLRRVRFVNPEDGHAYEFLTNIMHLSALQIADIYKERWQVELFFKWIKGHLKIKSFLGTSRNAVLVQIFIALCAYLMLAFMKFISASPPLTCTK
jgi:hypothetical protein